MDETKTTTCPHRARTIIPYTASNRGSVISILRRLPGKSLQFCISGFRFSNPQSRTQHFSLDRWWMFTCFAISPEWGPPPLMATKDHFPNGPKKFHRDRYQDFFQDQNFRDRDFFETKYFWDRYWDFFRDQMFSRPIPRLFWDQMFSRLIPRLLQKHLQNQETIATH